MTNMIGSLETLGGLYKIRKGSDFYEGFHHYTMNKENEGSWKFFNTRKYRISPKVISSRTMNNWQKEGLLPENCQPENQKWRIFTLSDIIWIAIVKELRQIGVSIPILKKAKKRLKSEYNQCEYGELEYFSARSLFFKVPCDVLVFNDGSAEVGTIYEIEESKPYGIPTNINISVNGILQSVFREIDLTPDFNGTLILEPKEAKIINSIRQGDYEKVTLTKKGQEWDSIKKVDSSNSLTLHEMQMEGGRQNFDVKYNGKKITHVTRTIIEDL